MKTVKVFNAKAVKVMKAGRKENRKSVLVVPERMSVKERNSRKLKAPIVIKKEAEKIIIEADSRGVHYDHNINKNEK